MDASERALPQKQHDQAQPEVTESKEDYAANLEEVSVTSRFLFQSSISMPLKLPLCKHDHANS